MAVYTHLTHEEIQALADGLSLGSVTAIQPVAAGVENTTYFLSAKRVSGNTTTLCEYVLTISESISTADLAFIAELCELLFISGLPVPAPLRSARGAIVMAGNKPAVVVPKMPGTHPTRPTIAQCASIGAALGHMHLATQASGLHHISHRSLGWVAETGVTLLPYLTSAERALMAQELAFLSGFTAAYAHLPQAVIHGDLFCDNALFSKNKLTAVIDFFSAGTGFLLLDLAIAANAWCRDNNTFSAEQLRALTASYSSIRFVGLTEIDAWPDLLRIAALRFWVSRLAELHIGDSQRPPGLRKDPREYKILLENHRDHPLPWPAT